LFPLLVLSFTPLCRGDQEELKKVAESLPGKLLGLMKAHEERIDSGVTMEMVEGLHAVIDGLLPELVKLEGGEDGGEALKEIQRDMAGAASAVYYRNHATGWGGTITTIEMAAEQLGYVETRICHAVTNAFEEKDGFDLEAWHAKWEAAGGSTGEPYGDAIEAEEESLRIVGERIEFGRGMSGGVCEEPAEGLAGRTLELSAKAGQKVVIAATGVRVRLHGVGADGKVEAFSGWGRCHEVKLPESKAGAYRIEFGKKEAGSDEPARFLLEIR
jgi:hypothetical protein